MRPSSRLLALRAGMLGLVLLAVGPMASAQDVPRKVRTSIASAARSLAEAGLRAESLELRGVLVDLGHPEDELAKLDGQLGKPRKRPRALPKTLPRDLSEQAKALASDLETLEGEARLERARLVLLLDDQEPQANRVLGHHRSEGETGRWQSPGREAQIAGSKEVLDQLQAARKLELSIQVEPLASAALAQVLPDPSAACTVSSNGVTLHGAFETEQLSRILREALRGAALSNRLLGGPLAVPRSLAGRSFILMDSKSRFRAALSEARANEGLRAEDYEHQLEMPQNSFIDLRGWRTCNFASDAQFSALLLFDMLPTWVDQRTQACLQVGHLNWICTNMLGVPMPGIVWGAKAPELQLSKSDMGGDAELLWYASMRTFRASRLWAALQLLHGQRTEWSRCMVAHNGLVAGRLLIKSTLVVAYLQEQGRLVEVMNHTRGRIDRPQAFAEALGESLEGFERDWERWLTDSQTGLAQRVEAKLSKQAEPVDRGPAGEFLKQLRKLRARALSNLPWRIEFDAELSRAAELHAVYLRENPDLRATWKDLHRERPDRTGYTPAGSRSGLASLIWTDDTPRSKKDPARSLEDWMGTLYHRLPLLEPSLFGVGLGSVDGVVVLDTSTLLAPVHSDHWIMWPPPGASDIPLRFVPEHPNPVPGEDQAALGYPITLQVRRVTPERALQLELELWAEGAESPVPCHGILIDGSETSSPGADTWCLIPRAALEPRTSYRVLVTEAQPGLEGSDSTGPSATEDWRFSTER